MNDVKNKVIELDINDVLPNRFQPRVKFNEDAIIELSESIKEHGIIQPIIVRPIGDKYEIIAGERRYKASILAGKDTIPSIITDLNDKDSAEIALIENVQRKNLTPIEEAVSYKKILDMGLTQEQLALKLGRSQSSIANKMRLLHLSDEVQEALIEEKISERHARSLLKLSKPEYQNKMLERIIEERLTVRKTDEEIEKMKEEYNMVEEPESVINIGAFNNNNPGFTDVNRIENQAREITPDEPKVDINKLLQPDSSSMNKAPEKKENDSSILNIFNKQGLSNIFSKPAEPAKEEVKPILDPIPTEDSAEIKKENRTFIPLNEIDDEESSNGNEFKISNTFNFEPLSFDKAEPKESVPSVFDNVQSQPLNELPSMTNQSRPIVQEEPIKPIVNEVITPVISETPKPVETIEPKPSTDLSSLFKSSDIQSFKPAPEIEVIEPKMPTIDLSKFNETPGVKPNEIETLTSIIPNPPVQAVQQTPVTPAVTEVSKPAEQVKPTPIIISDYEKQYDPVIPTAKVEVPSKIPFKDVLSSIRDNVEYIENSGYKVDTDEIDLGNEYRFIITIDK